MSTGTTGTGAGEGGSGGGVPLPKSRRGVKGFFKEVGREMKKVNWPTKKETNRLTGVVMGVTLLCVAILTGMGKVFETLVNLITKGNI